MNSLLKAGTTSHALPYDEIELLKREVEARFGRRGRGSDAHDGVAQPDRGPSGLRRLAREAAPDH